MGDAFTLDVFPLSENLQASMFIDDRSGMNRSTPLPRFAASSAWEEMW